MFLEKAVDNVNHKQLNVLQDLGFRGGAHKLLKNDLLNGEQLGVISNKLVNECGFP